MRMRESEVESPGVERRCKFEVADPGAEHQSEHSKGGYMKKDQGDMEAEQESEKAEKKELEGGMSESEAETSARGESEAELSESDTYELYEGRPPPKPGECGYMNVMEGMLEAMLKGHNSLKAKQKSEQAKMKEFEGAENFIITAMRMRESEGLDPGVERRRCESEVVNPG
eukprot:3759711-Alexandrium_andersonii.AAC.1